MPYGNRKDWLLCLGVIAYFKMPLMPGRNPDGHSPRYWRKHRSVSALPAPIQSSQLSASLVILTALWSWWGVGFSAAFCLGAGVSAMYSNDNIVAATLFFIGVVILVAKCLSQPDVRNSANPKATAAGIIVIGVFVFSGSLSWNRHVWSKSHESPAFSAYAANMVTNAAVPLWSLDTNTLRSNYFCEVTSLVKLYVTNNRQRSVIIGNLKVEGRDLGGQWRRLGILTLAQDPLIYVGKDWRVVHRWRPDDSRYFTLQMLGKNIQPGETIGGVLLMSQDLNFDIQGPLRVTISNLQGETSVIEIDSAKEKSLPNLGFIVDKGDFDMSGMKIEPCPLLWPD